MPQFAKGDFVRLNPAGNTASKAFAVLSPNSTYIVESVSPTCSNSACPNPGTGTIRIGGKFYCAESFQPGRVATPMTVGQAGVGATPVAHSAIQTRKGDPAKTLYASEADWYDTLPDASHEDIKNLPTLEQLDDEYWKKRGYPGSPTRKLP